MTAKKKPAPPVAAKKKPAPPVKPAKVKGKVVKTRKDGKPSRAIPHAEKLARQSIGNPKVREKPVPLPPREKGQADAKGKRGPYCESRKVGNQVFHKPRNPESKSGRVWKVCDAIKAKGREVVYNDVLAALAKTVPAPTIASQICFWRAFNGVPIPQHPFRKGDGKKAQAAKVIKKKPAPPAKAPAKVAAKPAKPAKPAAPAKKPAAPAKKPAAPAKKPAAPAKKPAAPAKKPAAPKPAEKPAAKKPAPPAVVKKPAPPAPAPKLAPVVAIETATAPAPVVAEAPAGQS